MSDYYRPQRTRNLYTTEKPYKLSRSKLDLFFKCPRCFYLDRRLGVSQPPGYPFNLNSAVDSLLKKEFDFYRHQQQKHPLLIEHGIKAIPFLHPELDQWRDSLHRGIQFSIPTTNLTLTGGVDDVWIDEETKELIIVDYKATSKTGKITLDADWQSGYKRQIEIYQWLFRQNGFPVSSTAYFVYCNGITAAERFDKQLNFEISLIPYIGKTDWVEGTIQQAYHCLRADTMPAHTSTCDFCQYTVAIEKINMVTLG